MRLDKEEIKKAIEAIERIEEGLKRAKKHISTGYQATFTDIAMSQLINLLFAVFRYGSKNMAHGEMVTVKRLIDKEYLRFNSRRIDFGLLAEIDLIAMAKEWLKKPQTPGEDLTFVKDTIAFYEKHETLSKKHIENLEHILEHSGVNMIVIAD